MTLKTAANALLSKDLWRMVAGYFSVGGGYGQRLDTPAKLSAFIHARASHTAQTALYGYLKTRAGTRFPDLFADAVMGESINIAKWQIYLACVSDLSVFAGVLLCARGASAARAHTLINAVVAGILADAGTPADGGDDFAAGVLKVTARVAQFNFADGVDGDGADAIFTESPAALAHWSPVADELKKHDLAIIRNSIRFHWIEPRRQLRRRLDADALLRVGG